MTVKLIGDSNDGTGNFPGNYILYEQFICETSGTCSEVLIYSKVSGNAKVGIYADNGSDYPGNRLAKQDVGQAVTENQWNTITLEATCELVVGTKYWLVAITDASGASSYIVISVGVSFYAGTTFSTFTFPSSAPAGMTSANYIMAYQGYGTVGGAGWTGKLIGVTNPAKVLGIAVADIVRVNGVS